MQGALDDYYVRLGVSRTASRGELRRAYRLLALRWHPDRAGPEATELFQRISEAYQVLSDAQSRARYDQRLRDREPAAPQPRHGAATEYNGPGGRITWETRSRGNGRPPLDRLSGPLDELVARAVARRRHDGLVELFLETAEAAAGGVAAIAAPLPITCPTCTGVAAENRVWCRRCEHAGQVVDEVLLLVDIPAGAVDGAVYAFRPEGGALAPLRVRLRVGRAP
jgi:molecular chaperone DnaJ